MVGGMMAKRSLVETYLSKHIPHDEHGKGHDKGGIDQNQSKLGIEKFQRLHEEEEGNHRCRRWQETLREKPERHTLISPFGIPMSGQPIPGQRPKKYCQK
jgi:hypothetical protein